MEHQAAHSSAKFEGYYHLLRLPSGASLIYVLCTVRGRGHLATLVYIPDGDGPVYEEEIRPPALDFFTTKTSRSSAVDLGLGLTKDLRLFASSPPSCRYDFDLAGYLDRKPNAAISDSTWPHLTARPSKSLTGMSQRNMPFALNLVHITSRTCFTSSTSDPVPWSSTASTPEGPLVYLPLPLHWHVSSLASRASFSLRLPPEAKQHALDFDGEAVFAHTEKNWAHSFPTAHMWVKAYSPESGSGICLAGGRTIGVDAYLAGYRNPKLGLEVDFRPPFALNVLGVSPFMHVKRDWDQRRFVFSISDLTWRVDVEAQAPESSFFTLAAPQPHGFRADWMAESIRATVKVKVFRRTWLLGTWTLVNEESFDKSALEFGGEYYPLRGQRVKTA